MNEKRQAPRSPVDVESLVYLDEVQIRCRTKDVSEAGVSFVLPNFICPSLESKIEFQLMIPGRSKTNRGKIVRIVQDKSCTILGCEVSFWAN